ncbi:MAG: dTDP-4-dehydrorhamnose 3,5-epimerase [Gammaproteobacteria bacterium]|nr:dTDP-4-dehydrorhamnose 3,5-epimerase [Gammaproteobacteria bacterium]
MEVFDTNLDGVRIVIPAAYEDDRGSFMETFNARDFIEAGLPGNFVQVNHSYSIKGVLRGLHYQAPKWQEKLIRVINGEVFDVAVDIRCGSPTFGKWFGTVLSAANRKQLYVPKGFAHGFCVISETADVVYKCTELYEPSQDRGILWCDPDIGIEWPVSNPLISPKDAEAQRLSAVSLVFD